MGWFSNLISGGADKVIDSVGKAVDDWTTSDEERLQIKAIMQKELNNYKNQILQAQAQYDAEITKRLVSDNEHWLTRLVRPLSFCFVLFLFGLMVLADGNWGGFKVAEGYQPIIQSLLLGMVAFYFGSRGFEKVTKIKNPRPPENKTPLMQNFDNEL